MHFQFLIEDQSGAAFVKTIMERISSTNPNITYDCKPFGGIGHYRKKSTAKGIKTGKLLNDLSIYLPGFNKSLQGFPAVIMVVLDNDTRDTVNFRSELNGIAEKYMIDMDYVFCIAVEEMEAWLLGDEAAILAAYPSARLKPLHKYKQDSICGTWEVLADVVYPGGAAKLKKDSPTYFEISKQKMEWAQKIGAHMDIEHNRSPSFNYFITEVNKRLPAAD